MQSQGASPKAFLMLHQQRSEDAVRYVFSLPFPTAPLMYALRLPLEGSMRRIMDVLLLLLVDILIAHNLHWLVGEAISEELAVEIPE